MSANQLRLAAERLRARADKATDGPWRVCAEGSEGSRFAPAHGTPREQSRFIGIANGRVQPEDGWNADYIATVDPLVGLALADWLLHAAEDWRLGASCSGHALAIARLINGGAA
jgi:hypothetical protein